MFAFINHVIIRIISFNSSSQHSFVYLFINIFLLIFGLMTMLTSISSVSISISSPHMNLLIISLRIILFNIFMNFLLRINLIFHTIILLLAGMILEIIRISDIVSPLSMSFEFSFSNWLTFSILILIFFFFLNIYIYFSLIIFQSF